MGEVVFVIGLAINVAEYILGQPSFQANPVIVALENLAKLIGQILVKHHPNPAMATIGGDLVKAVDLVQNPPPVVGGAGDPADPTNGMGG